MAQNNKPAHEIRLGRIRATIWANTTEDRDVWFNVSIARSYKDENQWKDSASFRRDDLPIVCVAMVMAYFWIWSRYTPLENGNE